MEKTTLEKILTVARVLRGIVMIALVFSIASLVILVARTIIDIGEYGTRFWTEVCIVTLDQIGGELSEVPLAVRYAYLFLESGAYLVSACFAKVYFDTLLAHGTPFSVMGCNALRRFGIVSVIIGAVMTLVGAIIFGADNVTSNATGTLIAGIAFIAVSIILRYGAELYEKPDKPVFDIPVIALKDEE